jgi:hypothetical protein
MPPYDWDSSTTVLINGEPIEAASVSFDYAVVDAEWDAITPRTFREVAAEMADELNRRMFELTRRFVQGTQWVLAPPPEAEVVADPAPLASRARAYDLED